MKFAFKRGTKAAFLLTYWQNQEKTHSTFHSQKEIEWIKLASSFLLGFHKCTPPLCSTRGTWIGFPVSITLKLTFFISLYKTLFKTNWASSGVQETYRKQLYPAWFKFGGWFGSRKATWAAVFLFLPWTSASLNKALKTVLNTGSCWAAQVCALLATRASHFLRNSPRFLSSNERWNEQSKGAIDN